ncbi:hypothetical protein [Vibrio ouci]|uniref:Uncharacterized protein n=1 Tax=Vibrio ouci TaxID=2499078 RepID=A0A4Y8WAX8_9VIBR|nr:hypothetical protein [Vibrio ouci]TFH90090.1 hypothetical protein ELS82_18590 [Vibrio ouci]
MNKKDYYRSLEQVKKILLMESDPFIKHIHTFASIHGVVSSIGYSAFKVTDHSHAANNNGPDAERRKVEQAISSAKQKDGKETHIFELITSHQSLKSQLERFQQIVGENSTLFEMADLYLTLLERYSEMYNSYVKGYSPQTAYSLAFIANDLIRATDNMVLVIDVVLGSYKEHSIELPDGSEQLEIYLSNVPSVAAFAKKLTALNVVYSEVSLLLGYSNVDFPLTIDHIENGSLLTRLVGGGLGLTIVSSIFNVVAPIYIEKYLDEGKVVELCSIENTANLDAMFSLSEKLEENGVKVDDIQDNIAKCLRKITKATDELFNDQPIIEVNDKVYRLDKGLQDKLLEHSRQKLLGLNNLNQEV